MDRFCEHMQDAEEKRPNQLRVILIFLITPTTKWLIAGYPYATETKNIERILNKKSFYSQKESTSSLNEFL